MSSSQQIMSGMRQPCLCTSGGACLVDDVAECDLTATIFDPPANAAPAAPGPDDG
jgi:hypothetical protein